MRWQPSPADAALYTVFLPQLLRLSYCALFRATAILMLFQTFSLSVLFIELIGVAGGYNRESVVCNIRRKGYILIGNGGVHKVVVVRG